MIKQKINMNKVLKILATVLGIGLLAMSMGWSKDGFKFDFAEGVASDRAALYGYVLAASATVLQFIFSTTYRELNLTLLGLGIVSYVYSIGTNLSGITAMQGRESANAMGWILSVIMDVAPEPMIAWGLGQSLTGDVIGNIVKAFSDSPKPAPAAKTTYSKPTPSSDIYSKLPKAANHKPKNYNRGKF